MNWVEKMRSPKTNLEMIKSTYEGASASENAQNLLTALSKHIEWTEAEGSPYGGTYIGVEAVIKNVFNRIDSEWVDFKAHVNSYHEVKDKNIIIAEGTYSGTYKETGKIFQADFVHVWELEYEKIVKFKQYVDSYTIQMATVD